MASSILSPGQTAANSSEFTVGDTETVFIAVFTDTGANLPSGPVLTLQRADINGNFITVATAGFGRIFFSANCQQLTINSPGTYRVARPDISPWGVNIGVQLGV
ncbi:hypothetical protein Xoosp13_188 [Xanthomonas phage Xoo-sp13]|nr:hypothetical protein Xoosp13_188 [Xanthomonas phage Xoo-sp13]